MVSTPFSALPLRERWFVRARLFSAPLELIAERCPPGRIADIGCGHGALSALLAARGAEFQVTGVDPDARKIAWARAALGSLPGVAFEVGTAQSLADERSGEFDAVAIADVLYLIPAEQWLDVLKACRKLLRPGGVLLLKEAEQSRSWKYYKCLLQEMAMVKLFRRTYGSGGLGFRPREWTEEQLRQAGFDSVSAEDVSPGYATPHVLFTARAG